MIQRNISILIYVLCCFSLSLSINANYSSNKKCKLDDNGHTGIEELKVLIRTSKCNISSIEDLLKEMEKEAIKALEESLYVISYYKYINLYSGTIVNAIKGSSLQSHRKEEILGLRDNH